MSRRARRRAGAVQAKRMNVMPSHQRRQEPDSFHDAMAAAERLLRAQEEVAQREAGGATR